MKFKPICFFTSEFLTRGRQWRRGRGGRPIGKLRPVGKLPMLSESSWWSIEKSDMEIGKSATKTIVMLLSGKFFLPKKLSTGEGRGDLKSGNFFLARTLRLESLATWPNLGFCCPPPPDQKSWLRLWDKHLQQRANLRLYQFFGIQFGDLTCTIF